MPTAAIPCLHQIMALKNNEKQSNHEKQKPTNFRDGDLTGHLSGNLGNQPGDGEGHCGSQRKKEECDVALMANCCQNNPYGTAMSKIHGRQVTPVCRGDPITLDHSSFGDPSTSQKTLDSDQDVNPANSQYKPDGRLDTSGSPVHLTIAKNVEHVTSDKPVESNPVVADRNVDSSVDTEGNDVAANNKSVGSLKTRETKTREKNDVVTKNKSFNTINSLGISHSNPTTSRVTAQNSVADNSVISRNIPVKSSETCDINITNNMVNLQNDYVTAIHRTIESIKSSGRSSSDSDSGSTVSENSNSAHLELSTCQEITKYLEKLWDFQHITKEEERKLLLTSTNENDEHETRTAKILKTIPYLVQGTALNSKTKEKILINPSGKSAPSLLHEYCIRVLKVKPVYTITESGLAKTPFQATVLVDGLQYGTGMAASKKQARHYAAQRTLEIFMPKDCYDKLMDHEENLKVIAYCDNRVRGTWV